MWSFFYETDYKQLDISDIIFQKYKINGVIRIPGTKEVRKKEFLQGGKESDKSSSCVIIYKNNEEYKKINVFEIVYLYKDKVYLKENVPSEVRTLYYSGYVFDKKICFITAIFGSYEKTCKPFVKQSINTDFICFTDDNNIIKNGWIIDTTPYHIINKSRLDNDMYTNSFSNNKHTFNIAKYYKQSFHNIPILKEYDVVIWLDGSIEITYNKVSEHILDLIQEHKIVGWNHEGRNGILVEEVHGSGDSRYKSTHWNGQDQPYQDVDRQFQHYLNNGYNDSYYKNISHCTPHLGVWVTCFVAFLKIDEHVKRLLNFWYLQTLEFTTQDQVGFSYVCQKMDLVPYTLPNNGIHGNEPHDSTMFYKKHCHGK